MSNQSSDISLEQSVLILNVNAHMCIPCVGKGILDGYLAQPFLPSRLLELLAISNLLDGRLTHRSKLYSILTTRIPSFMVKFLVSAALFHPPQAKSSY